jgi:hypothetical protein
METTRPMQNIYDKCSYDGKGGYVKKSRDLLNKELIQLMNIVSFGLFINKEQGYDPYEDFLAMNYLVSSGFTAHFETDWLDTITGFIKDTGDFKESYPIFTFINDMEVAFTKTSSIDNTMFNTCIASILNNKIDSDRKRGMVNVCIGLKTKDDTTLVDIMNLMATKITVPEDMVKKFMDAGYTKKQFNAVRSYVEGYRDDVNFITLSSIEEYYSIAGEIPHITAVENVVRVYPQLCKQPRFIENSDFTIGTNYLKELIHICDKKSLGDIYRVIMHQTNVIIPKGVVPDRHMMIQAFYEYIASQCLTKDILL